MNRGAVMVVFYADDFGFILLRVRGLEHIPVAKRRLTLGQGYRRRAARIRSRLPMLSH
jgi:hypothetical protein